MLIILKQHRMKFFKTTTSFFLLLCITAISGCSGDDSNTSDEEDTSGDTFGQYEITFQTGDLEGTTLEGEFTKDEGAGVYLENAGTGNDAQHKATLAISDLDNNDFALTSQFILINGDQEVLPFGTGDDGPISVITMSFTNNGTRYNLNSVGGSPSLTDLEVGPIVSGAAPAGFKVSFAGVFSYIDASYEVTGALSVNLPVDGI